MHVFYRFFCCSGLSPVAAAAYTSLLYSSPWLGSSFPPIIPSLYPGSTGIPYPYSPGFFGGPLPPNPFAFPLEEHELNLSCTKCKENFTSLQKLSDHIQETSHYPDIDQLSALAGVPPNSLNDSKERSSHSPRPRSCHSADKESSLFGSKSLTSATPAKKARRDYVQTSPEHQKKHPASSFNFIRSLESTIKSAISKVDTVPNEDKNGAQRSTSKAAESNHRTGFSPFLRMTDSPNYENLKRTNHKSSLSKPQLTRSKSDTERENSKTRASESRPKNEISCNISSRKAFSTSMEKSESPLDLTVKKEEGGKTFSSNLAFPATSQKPLSSSSDSKYDHDQPKDAIDHSRMQSSPYKSPLQSLHDMQAFFSVKKSELVPMGQNGMTSPPKNTATIQPDPYKPLMMPTNVNFPSSNPLQEILKIVNSKDLTKVTDKRCEERLTKRSSVETSSVEPKKSKLFSWNDLVMPEEETLLATGNPLQKIQDLVDNKLVRGSESRRKSEVEKLRDSPTNRHSDALFTVSSSGSRVSEDSALSATSSAASALLSLRTSVSGANLTNKNGFHRNCGVTNSFSSQYSSGTVSAKL